MPELRHSVTVGSAWWQREHPGSLYISGPAHVVIRNDSGAVVLLTTVGRRIALTAEQVETHFIRFDDGELVERDLACAEREADELEQRAAAMRRAITAFRDAHDG